MKISYYRKSNQIQIYLKSLFKKKTKIIVTNTFKFRITDTFFISLHYIFFQ